MSNDAPPPPPEDRPDSEGESAGEPTVAVPSWAPAQAAGVVGGATDAAAAAAAAVGAQQAATTAADAPTRAVPASSFDADVLSGDAPTRAVPAPTAPVAVAERPQLRPSAPPAAVGVRRVRLSISRVDPWSVMKLAFLLSVAIGIMIVVGAALVWGVLDSMEVFGKIEDLLTELRVPALLQLMDFAHFDSVISIATLIAVLDIVLLTALATIMALLYNITAALVGGVHLTMVDE
ncbi:MAG: DUF3566 domain-containing protein [Ruaniaceae bacterium]|nr:DUF3566 domain-containing protein [Ruaniaceae bacterium]